ncbi:hypothetical protein JXQ70_16730 [bacterium]|nr:hypothetical protein [bacterium]
MKREQDLVVFAIEPDRERIDEIEIWSAQFEVSGVPQGLDQSAENTDGLLGPQVDDSFLPASN